MAFATAPAHQALIAKAKLNYLLTFKKLLDDVTKDLQAKGGGTEDKWVHVSALKPVIRTEEGLILALYDGVKLKEVPSAMDPGPKYSNRPLPLVAEFSEFGLYASWLA